ncbi:MAG: ComEA family DNA-binding protein [Geminocystis sp.]|nr:ComEA family DNA-binding protein [Geminocystis sp.]MCS7146963.1 ComEA family DNA-binding protein [Geminocystis sp.]MCX8077275.1 ComEA family DNA-binding protein [Geminocystis sp.]MDW8115787.1 ComEA family DNA-binding protein [Geminocystis sp.]HIK37863.1 ComEA family DNA-binding protein [Geminocystis sp. M7585_C2015_104]
MGWLSDDWQWLLEKKRLAAKLKKNPYYRFQSEREIEIAGELGVKIDVNRATVDEWLRLPGISIIQAKKLVEIVNSGIPLLCIEDLAAALGVSVFQIQPWRPVLYFSYYLPDSCYENERINPNYATLNQLQQIPNLPPEIATKIIRERETGGEYRHMGDLKNRLDLDPQLAYHLLRYFQF